MAEERIVDLLQELKTRVVILEREKDDAAPGPRVQLFVREVIKPIETAVNGIERAVEKQAAQMSGLAEQSEELYEAHKSFLSKEQARKDEEAKEKTLTATVKRWGAISAAIGSIWFLFRIGGTLLEAYLKAHGFTP